MINKDDIEAFTPEQMNAILRQEDPSKFKEDSMRYCGNCGYEPPCIYGTCKFQKETARPETASLRGVPNDPGRGFMEGAIDSWIKDRPKYSAKVRSMRITMDTNGHADAVVYNPVDLGLSVVLGANFSNRIPELLDMIQEAIIPTPPAHRINDGDGGRRNQQIYAYTEPTPPTGYAQFLQVFNHVGWTTVVIRDNDATEHFIRIPTAEFIKLQNVNAYGKIVE